MGTVRYTVFDGEITSEYRNGVLHDYLVDPLGSTVALVDNTQTITDTFSYSAFGEVVNRTGTTPTPFQYVGSKGYYRDSSTRTYVRARNFYVNLGKWSTLDPIWYRGGDFNLYRYVENNPISYSDPSGNRPMRRTRPKKRHPKKRPNPVDIYNPPYIPIQPSDPNKPKLFDLGLSDFLPILMCEVGLDGPLCAKGVGQYLQRQGNKGRIWELFPSPVGNVGGPRDAVRHCLLACLVASECGTQAYRTMVLGHEDPDAFWAGGHWDEGSGMDLANDQVGFDCYKKFSGAGEACEACCMDRLKHGGLYMWDPKFRHQ